MFMGSAAFAATVNVTGGPVSVNKGSGFKSVKSSTGVGAGDTVTAGAGGSAKIVYSDGCEQTVGPGETVTVGASPCQAGALGGDMETLVVGTIGAAAVAGGIYAVTKDDSPSSP